MKLPVLIMFGMMLVAVATPAAVEYEGTAECDAMKVTVTFVFDEEAREIREVKMAHSCIEGGGGMTISISNPISVAEDGSFSSSQIRGLLKKDGSAEGEILGWTPRPQCSDGEFHSTCDKWAAKKK